MTEYETVAVVVSIIAFLATVVNIILYVYLTKQYNNMVNEQNKISQGQSETELRMMVMSARQEIMEASEKQAQFIVAFQGDENQKELLADVYEKMLESAQEDLRNAYEEACSRYLDGKVDKVRFERMYEIEIRNLVEDKEQKKVFDSQSSPYECIIKVYKKWNKHED